jgi:DNA-binding PadR family transcriptional regulator
MTIRNAILAFLSQHPRHGYELRAALLAMVGGETKWNVKPAQVYTTLDRLEEAGFITRDSDLGEGDEPDRRIYAITHLGEAQLRHWFENGVEPEHHRDEFFLKIMAALVSGGAEVETLINTQRSLLNREVKEAIRQRSHFDERKDLAQILRLDKAIMQYEAELHWLDMLDSHLDEIERQPIPVPEIRPRGRPKKIPLEQK